MRRKYFFISLAATALLLLGNVIASAQTGQLRGHVLVQQADGKKVPVAGAIVDVYRTDIPTKFDPAKTNSKGEFVFAGLPFVGKFVVAISAPNIRPQARGGVLVGRDQDYEFVVDPGDGKRMTKEEALSYAAASSSNSPSEMSAEDKARIEEMKRKNEEIAANNRKAENANAIVNRTVKAGNDALKLGDDANGNKQFDVAITKYTEAIAQYDEGITADPTHPGAPVLLTNKSVALKSRGIAHYNLAVRNTDEAAKTAGMEAAKKDFRDAAESAAKAIELLKATTAPTDQAALTNFNLAKYFAFKARADALRMVTAKADPSQADLTLAAYQEYWAVETKPEEKLRTQLLVAQMLLDTGQGMRAAQEFKKILEANPDNVDAMLGVGLSLFNTGDKANFQEAANFLQRFIDKAPDTHPLKQSAKDSLDYLKTQENVKPQKGATPARRKG